MNEPVIIDSGIPGPTVVILGGVHGDETCGVVAIDSLRKLRIKKGKLILIYGNPLAIERGVRFVDENLNRLFCQDHDLSEKVKRSYEYRRSRQILPYLDTADYVLDLHASFTPASKPFIICEQNAREYVQYLPQSLICYGFTRLEPGGSDGYMNRSGKVGICIECGYLKDKGTADAATHAANVFLQTVAMVDGPSLLLNQSQAYVEAYDLYYTQTDNFRLCRLFADFEPIKQGEIIAYDADVAIESELDQQILFATDANRPLAEGFLLVRGV